MKTVVDRVIIGAGMFGLYSALELAKKGFSVRIIDSDLSSMSRASCVNQARLHLGYHYPRSLSTARSTAHYYRRFIKDYPFAINNHFKKIYAISRSFSHCSLDNFIKFCKASQIPCNELNLHAQNLFNPDLVEAVFETEESSFDYIKLKDYFIDQLSKRKNVTFSMGRRIASVVTSDEAYQIKLDDNTSLCTSYVLNATYSGINTIHDLFGIEDVSLKYELTEICLGKVSKKLIDFGLTLMDGPFFSLMPFGLSGYHSLSSVFHTPHQTSVEKKPSFSCQVKNIECSPEKLQNCNHCAYKPESSWNKMYKLASKYLKESPQFKYSHSLFAVKVILKETEVDDARPTLIIESSKEPKFITVMSGKINTIYDLDEVLN